MPPNKKGGKNYKKGKHTDDEPTIYERLEDQMYARVIKVLGNCNLLVFCNDGRERICHIRGNMRKKVWMTVGDIVLISIRDFGKEEAGKMGRGDVCAKYDHAIIQKLRQRDDTISPFLFNNLESIESNERTKNAVIENEGGFEFDDDGNNEDNSDNVDDDEDDNEDNNEGNNEVNNIYVTSKKQKNTSAPIYANRLAQRKAAAYDSDSDNNNNDEINIDDI
jgi:translation initiation factor 1A